MLPDPNPWIEKVIRKSVLIDLVYKNLRIISKDSKSKKENIKADYDDEYMVSRFKKTLNELVERSAEIAPYVVIPTFSNRLRSDQSYEQQLESARTHMHHIPYLNLDDMVTVFERYNEVIREYSDRENVVVIETDVALAVSYTAS